jgi:hypothetical protein
MNKFTTTIKHLETAVKLAVMGGIYAMALSSGTAQATPTQGTLGSTSTGVINISVSVPNRARITNLSDVTITNQDPNTAVNSAQSVCVWSNTSTKNYTVTATGSGSSSAFTLANSTLTVPYSVEWSGSTGQSSGTILTAGTASAAFTSTATNQTCASGPSTTASLIVNMATSDLGGMQAQTNYTGTLTLVVAPQ